MGMYTDFCFDVELKANTPPEIIELLDHWMNRDDLTEVQVTTPQHDLFNCTRWRLIGWCGSAYFDAQPHRHFKKNKWSSTYILNIRCNLKNYEEEIQKFIAWITPFLDHFEGDFLGFYRYEESNEPTLIYMPSEGI